MKDSEWMWVLLIPLFLGMDTVDKKRKRMSPQKRSNMIGLVALGVFFIAIVCYVTYGNMQERQAIQDTVAQVNNMAVNFANHTDAPIQEWAQGKIVDPWEGQLILTKSSSKDGVQVVSKGPDGDLNTEDDIRSETVQMQPRYVIVPPKKPSIWQKTKSKASAMKNFFIGD